MRATAEPLTPVRGSVGSRAVQTFLSLACAAAASMLAMHHPWGAWAPVGLAAAFAALAWFSLPHALMCSLALLSVANFSPWTGWFAFDESDILVLAIASGGYARLAWWPQDGSPADAQRQTPTALLLLSLMAISLVISMQRGFADAGGFAPSWFAGYRESMNALRSAKGFVLAALSYPLWAVALRAEPMFALRRVSGGLVLCLAFIALGAIWERLAFPGLLNFSADYRTTALFAEMNVGGAALDGFLALTIPFAVHAAVSATRRRDALIAGGTCVLAAYAALTTFSRGVYLAVPVGLSVLVVLMTVQKPRQSRNTVAGLAQAALLLAAFGAGAFWLFQGSGYRGLLAWLGALSLLLGMKRADWRDWVIGLLLAVILCLSAAALRITVAKGAYLAFAATWAFGAVMQIIAHRRDATFDAAGVSRLAIAGFIATLGGVVLVALDWGGATAALDATAAVTGMLAWAVVATSMGIAPARASLHWRGSVLGAAIASSAAVGVLLGGAYMGGRISGTQGDMLSRFDHWRHSLALIASPPEKAFGKGLGRFADNFALTADPTSRPGDYRRLTDGSNGFLALSGGTHLLGWGELLRVSQRVAAPRTPLRMSMDVRLAEPAIVHVEVCEKHLIYSGNCQIGEVRVDAERPGTWRQVHVQLTGPVVPTRGSWYAPRLIAFSIAMQSAGHRADFDNLRLVGADGENMLSNGDFEDGMAHWFFTSDRLHMPWHAKNLVVHQLVEQGWVGTLLLAALIGTAFWRLCLGPGRRAVLAPPLAAGIAGFLVVGAFDSLLNVPRLSFLFYLLLIVALGARGREQGSPGRSGQPGVTGTSLRTAAWTLAWTTALVASLGLLPAAPVLAREDAAQSLRVGPSRPLKTLAEASRVARDGAVIEVDAGTYVGDTAVWTQRGLRLRASGGRVRLLAGGAAVEGKGIWVVRATDMQVEGFDFEGAAVPSRNGAGIRLDSGSLRVRDCSFVGNEMGLLTNNDPDTELDIENSEFAHNQRPDGHNHQLYVGYIKRLSVTGSYFHHGRVGHLLKSRAASNYIAYNRLTDEADGSASYELEFPSGGVAHVIGNIIQQSAFTENPVLVSFGAEGYRWPSNELYLSHNTLVDDRSRPGTFVRVRSGAGAVRVTGNLLVGEAGWDLGSGAEMANNVTLPRDALSFAGRDAYHARPSAVAGLRAVDPGTARGVPLTPSREYLHPRGTTPLQAPVSLPGALQSTAVTNR